MDGLTTTLVATVDDFDRAYKGSKATISRRPLTGLSKTRRVNLLLNSTNGVKFGVHNSNVDNVWRALLERVFLVQDKTGQFTRPPQAVPELFESRMKRFKQQFLKEVTPTTKWTREQFLATYTGRRLTSYQKAVESLNLKPFTERDAEICAFSKAEKVNLSAKENPCPRAIQPRSLRYNATIGVYIKCIEKKVYRDIAKVFGSPTVSKCLNADEMGHLMHQKWSQFKRPVAVGLDASRFDQHCGVVALSWEHSVYRRYFPGDKWLAKLLRMQLYNRGYARTSDGIVRYKTEGCRMSGDMNTGLGNCVLMCAMIYSYMNELGFRTSDYSLINNGDDCVLFMESASLARLNNLGPWFKEMGYTMKIEPPVYILEQVQFCQTQPVFVNGDYRACRNPHVCMTKDLVSIQNVSTEGAWAHQLQALADCGRALAGDMPVYYGLYQSLVTGRKVKQSTEQRHWSGMNYLSIGMHTGFTKPSDESRVSFWRAFGILPDKQEIIEVWYLNMVKNYNPHKLIEYPNCVELSSYSV